MKNEERLFYREEGLRLFDSVEVEMHYNLEMEENNYSIRKPRIFSLLFGPLPKSAIVNGIRVLVSS